MKVTRFGWRRALLVGGLAAATLVLAMGAWLATPVSLLPQAQAALQSSSQVAVAREAIAWAFRPVGPRSPVGLVWYPGGRIPPAAYAPAAVAIAARGFAVFVVDMPFNEAFLAPDRAAEVQRANPGIRHWVVGGHSLGGAMAAAFASGHPGAVDGVVFWGAYSAADLSQRSLSVLTVFGARERGRQTYLSQASRAKLPPDARYVEIAGGNHEQFGYYTGQFMGTLAEVDRETQQAEAVAATVSLLERVQAIVISGGR